MRPSSGRLSGMMSVSQAAASGSQLELLLAMQRRVAEMIDDPDLKAADLSALSRRQLEIAKEIQGLQAGEEQDDIGAAAATPDEDWPAS